MHTPQLSDEVDRLHVDSTLFTAVQTSNPNPNPNPSPNPNPHPNPHPNPSPNTNPNSALVRRPDP